MSFTAGGLQGVPVFKACACEMIALAWICLVSILHANTYTADSGESRNETRDSHLLAGLGAMRGIHGPCCADGYRAALCTEQAARGAYLPRLHHGPYRMRSCAPRDSDGHARPRYAHVDGV